MTLEEAAVWVSEQEFVYAKSYAKTLPHHYTTRDRCNVEEFEAFLSLIRHHGKLKPFYKKQYMYLELDDYEYWEMGRPLKAVQVLNRAKIDDTAHYRKVQPNQYDEEILRSKLILRDLYLSALLLVESKSEKDEREVRFLLDNQRRIHGGGKNIIDHSTIEVRYE